MNRQLKTILMHYPLTFSVAPVTAHATQDIELSARPYKGVPISRQRSCSFHLVNNGPTQHRRVEAVQVAQAACTTVQQDLSGMPVPGGYVKALACNYHSMPSNSLRALPTQ